uniref:Uncharacterized protein n=1 Tax=Peronospora matthiolae TaxID=2874970 RepID=A0AAV1UGT7_9STRA
MRISAWFDLFKFNWFRRCRSCGVRGSKCLCHRPSLALEHIFFLEERKNKFGARNFSHVSDTLMTTNSTTMLANSTSSMGASSSNVSGSTVVMWGSTSFMDSEVNPTDYVYDAAPSAFSASACSHDSVTSRVHPVRENAHNCMNAHRHQMQRSIATSDVYTTTTTTTTTLVRKQSGRMVSKPNRRHHNDATTQPPIKEIVMGEFVHCTEENVLVSLPHRRQQFVPHRNRRAQSKSATMNSTRPQYKEEPGVSFQFYGRGGTVAPAVSVSSTLMGSNRSMSSTSTTDSFCIGPSSISSVRASQCSSRVSLETNYGSLNQKQSLLNNKSRFIDGGYAPSIQENGEAQALQQLTGWFLASSIPTQESSFTMTG